MASLLSMSERSNSLHSIPPLHIHDSLDHKATGVLYSDIDNGSASSLVQSSLQQYILMMSEQKIKKRRVSGIESNNKPPEYALDISALQALAVVVEECVNEMMYTWQERITSTIERSDAVSDDSEDLSSSSPCKVNAAPLSVSAASIRRESALQLHGCDVGTDEKHLIRLVKSVLEVSRYLMQRYL